MSAPSMKSWKSLWLEAQKLTGTMTATIYRRTKALVAVFNDAVFRADNNLRDDAAAADFIDDAFPPLGLTFLQLRYLLNRYAAESQWKNANLAALYAEARAADANAEADDDKPARTATRPTKADYATACDERDHWKTRTSYLEKQLDQTVRELNEARITIAKQAGQIEELERLLRRDLVAA